MIENTALTAKEDSLMKPDLDMAILSPIVDIFENETEMLLYAEMPGVTKDMLTVNINNGKLELTGKRSVEKVGTAIWQEFGNVLFKRTFAVPQTINVDAVNAKLTNGVLQLHMPKAESAKPKQIEIHTVN